MNTQRIQINHLVSSSIRRHNKVAVLVTKQNPQKNKTLGLEYINFTKQIENTFLELSNEIVDQLEMCSYDYPDEYTCLAVTSPEGHEIVHVIYGP